MRGLLTVLLLGVTAALSSAVLAASIAEFEVQALDAATPDPAPDAVTSGSLDYRFGAFKYRDLRRRGGSFWLKLRSVDGFMPAGVPTLIVHKGRHLQIQLFASYNGESIALPRATELSGFSGLHDAVFVLPAARSSW